MVVYLREHEVPEVHDDWGSHGYSDGVVHEETSEQHLKISASLVKRRAQKAEPKP